MAQGNNIHTNTSELSSGLSLIRKGLRLTDRISTSLTTRIVTRLFCKPSRQRMKRKHHVFYQQGRTDTLSIRGFEVKVLRLGAGERVYLSHGWGSLGYNMRPMVETLVKAGYEVILPDLPCHGRSSGTFINQIEMAKVVKVLLLHYHSEKSIDHIVTHSWGGTVTLLAMDGIRKEGLSGFNIRNMVSVSMPSAPNAIMDIFCDILGLSQPVRMGLYQNIEAMAREDDRTLEEAFPVALNDLLDAPEFAYTLIHGKEDQAIPFTNSVELIESYPQISAIIMDGLGHIDILRSDKVQQAVLNRLAAPEQQRVLVLETQGG